MEWPRVHQIGQRLREDLDSRLQQYGVMTARDPVLAAVLQTLAVQLEHICDDTRLAGLSVIDELIGGLGVPPRMARPAQALIQFSGQRANYVIPRGTAFLGEADTGDKLLFATDCPLTISPARIAMAFAYQEGLLQLLPAVPLGENVSKAIRIVDPMPAALGSRAAIFIAVEDATGDHLSGHSFSIQLSDDSPIARRAVLRSTWCLASSDGSFQASGLLRPQRTDGGVYKLEWLLDGGSDVETAEVTRDFPTLPDGACAGSVYVLPSFSAARRLLTRVPRGIGEPLRMIFGEAVGTILKPRAWFKITFLEDVEDLSAAVTALSLHSMSVSNVECLSQKITFNRDGYSIPLALDSERKLFPVSVCSVLGTDNTDYRPIHAADSSRCAGVYSIRNGRILLKPASRPDRRPEDWVTLRVWMTNGQLGNQIGPGKIIQPDAHLPAPELVVTNLTSATGGTDGETAADGRRRLEEALLSRDRVVTRADLIAAIHAFDSRIQNADVEPRLVRSPAGLRRVHAIQIAVSVADFDAPSAECRVLQQELRQYLQDRVPVDLEIVVEVECL